MERAIGQGTNPVHQGKRREIPVENLIPSLPRLVTTKSLSPKHTRTFHVLARIHILRNKDELT